MADKVNAAHQAFLAWRETTFPQRVEKLRNAARILTDHKEEYAALMATEMGKPIRHGRAEIEKCAWVCDYYADTALTALQPEFIETDARRCYVSFNPLGVILAIMPWNYPFWQVFRFAAPTLMADNAAVLKHASNVPDCSLAIEEIFGAAGFPENLFQNVLLAGKLEAGNCFVNAFVKSDPRLPFGGIKQSGYGRELSHCGIKEFVNIKTVYVG